MVKMSETLTIKPADARKEIARRELARRHLVDFSQYIAPWYRPGRHHRLVGEYLEQVETYIRTGGKTGIGRLMVFEPPQNGKSEQVSKHFPAWLLGRLCAMYQQPCHVITTSYNADRATENSRAAREIVMGPQYQAVFGNLTALEEPVSLSTDSRSVEKWDLAAPHRGGMLAAGVGGGVTGYPANLFILDDPLKNREEADSQDRRDLIWDWWLSSAYTRLRPGAAVVLMLTRWHSDDLAGRFLKSMATNPLAEQWVVLDLPAIWEVPEVPEGKTIEQYQREKLLDGVWVEQHDLLDRAPGQALWPEEYPLEWLEIKRANIGPYDWAALYQQSPYLRSGNMFKRQWFGITENFPDPTEIVAQVRYWDKAATAGGGKYSVGVLIARMKGEIEIVLDVVRGQWSRYEREQQIVRTAQLDGGRPGPKVITWHEQEPGSSGKDSAQATNLKLAQAGFSAHFETATGDKETRAQPWSSQAEGGGVRLLRGGWNQEYIEELVSFPKGRYKDQVDTSSGAHARLNDAEPQGWFMSAPNLFTRKPKPEDQPEAVEIGEVAHV